MDTTVQLQLQIPWLFRVWHVSGLGSSLVSPLRHTAHTMVKELDPSINESTFLLQALEEKRRIDGRGIYDVRSIDITFGADYGQVNVQLGRTRYKAIDWHDYLVDKRMALISVYHIE